MSSTPEIVTLLLEIVIGAAVLFLGRQLFWIFVGAVGFVVGIFVGALWFSQFPEWPRLLLALGAGMVFALLAIVIQRPMAGLAGFVAMGLTAVLVFRLLGGQLSEQFAWLAWPVFLVGGMVGAVVVFMGFDWGLIFLSALLGTNIIISALDAISTMTPLFTTLFFIVLFVLGISVQSSLVTRSRPGTSRSARV